MQLCPGFARQCALETALVAPSPHNTPVIPIKNISCAILGNDSVLGIRGPVLAKKPRKKCEKIWLLTKKGVPLHSLFGNDADGMRAGAPRG